MADERIDIEITDKVDSNVEKKIERIASAAERGESYIKRLKTALASVNSSSLDRLASAMAKIDSAQAKLISAQARLTNAQNQSSAAAQKAALAEQKLATEAARTEAAVARAATATTQAATAATRLQAAQSGLAGSSNAAASAATTEATAVNSEAAAMTHASGAASSLTTKLLELLGINRNVAASAGQVGAASQRMAQGYGNSVNAANQYTRAARTTSFVNANIVAQMQDIGVSLAGGQNPLLVMIQQGSQLSYIASTLKGGWSQLIVTMTGMLAKLAPLAVILGTIALLFKKVKDEANADAELTKFAEGLGLTRKELKQLDDVTVTWGDTWNGLMDTIAERLGTTTTDIKNKFSDAFSKVAEFAQFSVAIIYGAFYGVIKTIIQLWNKLPAAVGSACITAANAVIDAFAQMINFGVKGINLLIDGINAAFGKDITHIAEGTAKHIVDPFADAGKEVNDALQSNIREGFDQANKFFDDWAGNAAKRARARIAAQANEIIKDRTPKTTKDKIDHTAENRAHAIEMVNMKLDDELKRMRLLKDERAVQQRMDQIEESLAQKKIKLNQIERQTIEDKVRAIEAYKYVQSELDRIYESSVEPLRTYNATLQAAKELLDQNAISQKKYSDEVTFAGRKYAEAIDPLFQLKEQLSLAEQGLKNFGFAAKQAAYYEEIRQAYLKNNIVLSPQYVAGVNAEVDALMRRNTALQQGQTLQNNIQSTVGGIVDPMNADNLMLQNKQMYYDALNKMANDYQLSEAQRSQARYALDLAFNEKRLNAASQFFGTLAGLSSSGNKKLAIIGKAAAVAQATIDGYLAVQKALASAPPPWNVLQASAIAVMTGLNVAKIISTPVGNYKEGGQFMVGGRDGVDANNINMNVTKGERVTIETAAQQRRGDSTGKGPTVQANTKIINQFDERSFLAAIDSEEGEEIIVNIIRRNPQVMQSQ